MKPYHSLSFILQSLMCPKEDKKVVELKRTVEQQKQDIVKNEAEVAKLNKSIAAEEAKLEEVRLLLL